VHPADLILVAHLTILVAHAKTDLRVHPADLILAARRTILAAHGRTDLHGYRMDRTLVTNPTFGTTRVARTALKDLAAQNPQHAQSGLAGMNRSQEANRVLGASRLVNRTALSNRMRACLESMAASRL